MHFISEYDSLKSLVFVPILLWEDSGSNDLPSYFVSICHVRKEKPSTQVEQWWQKQEEIDLVMLATLCSLCYFPAETSIRAQIILASVVK